MSGTPHDPPVSSHQALAAAKTIENRLLDPFRRAKGGQG